ncbi:elongator complex protein 4-like [Brevipalpus obovatus]|uniref:elongator complex protein 4-like n=1 Tax=Brevipalpus obovatus TaxID=246614 RepID=UPI003D9DCDB0
MNSLRSDISDSPSVPGSSFKKLTVSDKGWDSLRTGIIELDQLFGSGIPMSTLTIIEQDEFNVYARQLIQCIASNSLYDGGVKILYFSCDNRYKSVEELVKDLPIRREGIEPTATANMEIAFRYNHMPSLQDKKCQVMFLPSSHGRIEKDEIEKFNINLENIVVTGPNTTLNKPKSTSEPHLIIYDNFDPSILENHKHESFIYFLKSHSRVFPKSLIVVTLQPFRFSIEARKRIRNLSDAAFCIESLDSSHYGEDFKALFHVIKMPSKPKNLVSELGIAIRKIKNHRRFTMEKLSIPPEGDDAPSRIQPTLNTVDIF